jgi:DNA-binding SARP family transcriptional activator/Flp pilus assembly protein TadD
VAAEMEFSLLGPLVVQRNGVPLLVSSAKQRALLATLLLNANRLVPMDDLSAALWSDEPPVSARVTLRNYVKELRKTLAFPANARIRTLPGGYLIHVAADELDVARFTVMLSHASAAASRGAWERAAALLGSALELWRGDALADVPSEWLALREVPRLAEMRLQAIEARFEAELQVGRHAGVIADLRQMAAVHPLRERLHVLLMLALYRDGQQAAALAAYQHARGLLVDELGAEPGPELRKLQQQILAADPALAGPGVFRPATQESADSVMPRELPAPVAHFTGRAAELSELSELSGLAGGAQALAICAVGGTAGVGKTALAVQWAHQVAEQFPDGQLYVNLRGYDPHERLSATDALASFLRTLGVPGTEIPDEEQDRARLYRSRLAGHRVLVLLDNARDADQVRPLLPGAPGCVAVVTSRDALAGLIARDGARRLDLDMLPLADAVALLRTLIGARADEDPAATAELAGLCARLPLALRIAAELAAARKASPLADLVGELAAGRLDLLEAGEDRTDVRAVLSWSVRQLPDHVAAAFGLIGLHPGGDLDVHAAAALTGTSAAQARGILDRLQRASLVHAAGPGRYGMHDLLRAYAREHAHAHDSVGHCQEALTRLFDYYLAAVAAAMSVLSPPNSRWRSQPLLGSFSLPGLICGPGVEPKPLAMPELSGEAGARAWLDVERANLVAVIVHCSRHGWSRHAADLTVTLHRYLINGSHLPEAQTIYSHQLYAACQSGDPAAEASALYGLGSICMKKGHFRDADRHYCDALERFRECGDRAGEARVLATLGMTEFQLHNHHAAADYQGMAIAAYRELGDSLGVAGALCGLSNAETELGSYVQASEHLQLALRLSREAEDQQREARALEGIGELSLRRGQLTQAADFFGQALTLYRSIDNPAGVANGFFSLGQVSLRRGEYSQAIGNLQQALAVFRQAGDQYGETLTLRTLAEALHEAGQTAAARAELTKALRLAADTCNTYQQASAHRDLAESYHTAGEDEQARRHWRQALNLYSQLSAAEADQIRIRFSAQRANLPR